MSFDLEVSKAVKLLEKDITRAVQNRTAKTMRKIVKYNGQRAFDTGKLVNSWVASTGSPVFDKEGGEAARDRSGPQSLKSIDGVQKKIRVGQDVFFTNSLHYADYVESGTARITPRMFLANGVAESGGTITRIDSDGD